MSEYTTRPLSAETWDAFAQLCEKHSKVWSGCWCAWCHPRCADNGTGAKAGRAYKERLVREGKAHAAWFPTGRRGGLV